MEKVNIPEQYDECKYAPLGLLRCINKRVGVHCKNGCINNRN